MWDLDTMHHMNNGAYEKYRRQQVASTLETLKQQLQAARPPSIAVLLQVFANVEDYEAFVELVQEYLPEREQEILRHSTPSAQMAAFGSYFEDRYLPLYPSLKDGGWEDDYSELLRGIPIDVMGFGWEDYHEMDTDIRLGMQLMAFIFEPPAGANDHEQAGERLALLDQFSPAYQAEAQRLPSGGVSLEDARRILKPKKWEGLINWGHYINMDTGNYFLDTDYEMLGNSEVIEWDKPTVEEMARDWHQADAYHAKMVEFAEWLEDEKLGPARFKQTIDFIVARLHKEGGDNNGADTN